MATLAIYGHVFPGNCLVFSPQGGILQFAVQWTVSASQRIVGPKSVSISVLGKFSYTQQGKFNSLLPETAILYKQEV